MLPDTTFVTDEYLHWAAKYTEQYYTDVRAGRRKYSSTYLFSVLSTRAMIMSRENELEQKAMVREAYTRYVTEQLNNSLSIEKWDEWSKTYIPPAFCLLPPTDVLND